MQGTNTFRQSELPFFFCVASYWFVHDMLGELHSCLLSVLTLRTKERREINFIYSNK